MELITTLFVLVLAARLIYSESKRSSTNFKQRYFRLPGVSPDQVPAHTSYIFKPTPKNLFHRFIWLAIFIAFILQTGFAFGFQSVGVVLIFFGLPFMFRLVSRLIHMNDHIEIFPDRVQVKKLFKSSTILFSNVKEVQLDYYLYRGAISKSIYVYLTFNTNQGEKKVSLFPDFFLEEAEMPVC